MILTYKEAAKINFDAKKGTKVPNEILNFVLKDMDVKLSMPKDIYDKFYAALKSQSNQIIFKFASIESGVEYFCANGLLYNILGVPADSMTNENFNAKLMREKSEVLDSKTLDTFIKHIARMNDWGGQNFSQIADWVSRNVEIY